MRATPVPARFLVTMGLVLLTLGGLLATVDATVSNRDHLVAQARGIAATGAVHDALAQRLANTIDPPDPHPTDDEIGQPNPAIPLAEQAVDEPAFTRAFGHALGALHDHVVAGGDRSLALDPELVGEAVAAARGGGQPVPVAMELDADVFPDAHTSLDALGLAAGLLLAAGTGLLAAGIATSRQRARVVMRVGRWAMVVGALGVLWCWAVPVLFLQPLGGWARVGGLVLGAGTAYALPALGVVLAGGVLLAAGHAWETRGRRRTLAVIPRRPGRETWAGPV